MFNIYEQRFEINKFEFNNKQLKYRYYNNPNSKQTIVLLVGGIGIADLIYKHFLKFSENFSVITFNYSFDCNITELCILISELLKSLNTKAWLVGQSLGGFIAQLVATYHPEVVDGLVLSNTGCLSENLSNDDYMSLQKMIISTKKSKKLIKVMPINLFKKVIRKKITKKHAKEYNEEEMKILNEVFNVMDTQLNRKYQLHMSNLLIDLQYHFNNKKENFEFLEDKVLLILSPDDYTFTQGVRDELINIMHNPKVINDFTGGHIALMVKFDKYINAIKAYVSKM